MTEPVNIETDYVERFSRKNPPPSREVALETIDEVTEINSSIESQLQFKSATDFPTIDAYRVWKDKAIAALAHSRNELQFLEKWLSVGDIGIEMGLPTFSSPIATKPPILTKKTRAMFQQDVMAKARAATREIESLIDKQPDTHEKKLLFFRQILQRVEEALLKIAMAGSNAQMSRNQIKDTKQPLLALKHRIVIRLGTIKNELPQSVGNSWKEVCVAALSRAQNQGFLLLEKEKEVLEMMRGWIYTQTN